VPAGEHDVPDARFAGTPLVVMLDVDGTLAPIASHPALAVVPLETRRAVAALAARPGVHIALVTGRAAADARRMVAVPNVWVIGNHGGETIGPDGELEVDPEVAAHGPALGRAAGTLAPLIAPLANVVLENKGWSLAVHYRMADPMIADRLRFVIEGVAGPLGLRVTDGKAVYEIRPPGNVDKGTAVLRLAAHLGALEPAASLLYFGDDDTDEDAFRALRTGAPHATTIVVGEPHPGRTSAAELRLADPAAVRRLLERIVERRGPTTAAS
jgi:trehalose-phosphatase